MDPRRADDVCDAITQEDAARLLGVSVRTIQRYIARGDLQPFYLPSGRPRIPLDQVNGIRRQTARRHDPAAVARARRRFGGPSTGSRAE